jgi:carboxyl-terminal processing protease
VQTIRNLPDGGALKITIAQYLTPGDVSIQGVGIVPDIELAPMTVDALDMDLDADKVFPREADLSAHLTNNRARNGSAPRRRCGTTSPRRSASSSGCAAPTTLSDDGFREDFSIRFARDLLAAAPRGPPRAHRRRAPLLDRTRAEQVAGVPARCSPCASTGRRAPTPAGRPTSRSPCAPRGRRTPARRARPSTSR